MDHDECSVCYNQTTEKTPCGHVLCLKCFMNVKNCPICREEFKGEYFQPKVEIVTVPEAVRTVYLTQNVCRGNRGVITQDVFFNEIFLIDKSGKVQLKEDAPSFFSHFFQDKKINKTSAKKAMSVFRDYIRILNDCKTYKADYKNKFYKTPQKYIDRHAEWLKTFPTDQQALWEIQKDDLEEYRSVLLHTDDLNILKGEACKFSPHYWNW